MQKDLKNILNCFLNNGIYQLVSANTYIVKSHQVYGNNCLNIYYYLMLIKLLLMKKGQHFLYSF